MTHIRLALACAALGLAWTGAARADLQVCNDTRDVQSVSIAYQGPDGWVSEGWWNIDPGACQLPLAGALTNRYYFYRSEVNAGAFEGDGYFFCTSPQVYEIDGAEDCEARGYDTEDFRIVDTGPDAADYTVRLTGDGTAPPPADDTSEDGLIFCNDTVHVQSVSVGYFMDDDWVSEGWWNIDPDACVPVLRGPLTGRYYYYRAEIEGGEFDGEGYFFCTSPEAYTIVGDANCRGRGYDEEDFAEIDVGDYESFVLTLVDDPSGRTVEEEESPRPIPEDDGGEDKETTRFPTFDRKDTPRPPRVND